MEQSNHLSWLARHFKLFSVMSHPCFSRAEMKRSYLEGICPHICTHHKLGNNMWNRSNLIRICDRFEIGRHSLLEHKNNCNIKTLRQILNQFTQRDDLTSLTDLTI